MAELPSVLVGPILRRVDARRVSVFLALPEPAQVTVVVFSGRTASTGAGTASAPELARGTVATRAFGAHLHAVVVDVEVTGLVPLTRYSYDVVVETGGTSKGLRDLGLLRAGSGTPASLPLGHATDMLPSFVTAGPTTDSVRLAHASCRKSHGPGHDALAWLDDQVEESLSETGEALQALFLTGDQIYADDVPGVLLPMLHGLAVDLVGEERLPVGQAVLPATLERFPALRRQGVVRDLARFTTTDGHNHLLTYGEYAAMYAAAFSPFVWRDLPSAESLFTVPPDDADQTRTTAWERRFGTTEEWRTATDEGGGSWQTTVAEEAERLVAWRDAVPKVARVLANVPTYMVFDDHEVTDDWNLSHRWRSRVMSAPFGRAVVRNALMAYAVFQAWGNDPQRFRHGSAVDDQGNPVVVDDDERDPNEKLLEAVTTVAAAPDAPVVADLDRIDELLGLHQVLGVPKARFHYEVPGPTFLVRVLDTRTRRTYAAQGDTPPRLLGGSLDDQLPAGPLADGRELLVVVSAAPVLFPRLFDSVLQPVSALAHDLRTHVGRPLGPEPEVPGRVTGLKGSEASDIEGWRSDETHHEALLKRLGGYRRVVVLSGDVHFASTLVLDYWGKGDESVDSRIVQCTSSAARNQPGESMRALLRTLRVGQQLLRGTPSERIGWEGDHGVVLPAGASVRPGRRARLRRRPAVLPARGWPVGTTLTSAPDWRWRLEVVRDERAPADLPAGAPEVPVLTWQASDGPGSVATLAGHHQQLAIRPKDPVRLMVFRNNAGLVRLATDGADWKVSHTLLSSALEDSGEEYTRHEVAFAPTPAPVAPTLVTG